MHASLILAIIFRKEVHREAGLLLRSLTKVTCPRCKVKNKKFNLVFRFVSFRAQMVLPFLFCVLHVVLLLTPATDYGL